MSAEQQEHTGIYAYPGTVATIITIVIGVLFVGGIYLDTAGGHGDDHGGDHAEEAATEGDAH